MSDQELRRRLQQLDVPDESIPEFHALLRRRRPTASRRLPAIVAAASAMLVLASAGWMHWKSSQEQELLAMARELSSWSAPSDAWPEASASPLLKPVSLSSDSWITDPNTSAP